MRKGSEPPSCLAGMGFAKTRFGLIGQSTDLCELRAICLADLVDGAVHAQVALLDPDRALADALDLVHGVAHEQHGDVAVLDEMLDATLALLLEEHVADGERLVDDEDVGLGDGGDGERDARDHARGEVLHGHVHEVGQLGKVDDLLEVRVDELLGVTEERAVEVDVLAGGELEVETRAELDQGRDVTADDALALAGLQHAGDDLEHGGFAGAIGANQAHDLAGLHLEGDVLECAELGEEQFALHQLDEVLLEVVELLGRHVEDHGDVVDFDGVFRGGGLSHGGDP